jgi:hypothetical protein
MSFEIEIEIFFQFFNFENKFIHFFFDVYNIDIVIMLSFIIYCCFSFILSSLNIKVYFIYLFVCKSKVCLYNNNNSNYINAKNNIKIIIIIIK